jgi:hypothetical protein
MRLDQLGKIACGFDNRCSHHATTVDASTWRRPNQEGASLTSDR